MGKILAERPIEEKKEIYLSADKAATNQKYIFQPIRLRCFFHVGNII